MEKIISNSEEETISFASKYAKGLKNGDVIILSGNLGAGKTKFVQGILQNFNLEDEISSPTFTIVNEYKSPNVNIYHFDLYRLADIDEFYAIGGEEYLEKGICIFEWGEILENELKQKYIKITIERNEENTNQRILTIEEVNS